MGKKIANQPGYVKKVNRRGFFSWFKTGAPTEKISKEEFKKHPVLMENGEPVHCPGGRRMASTKDFPVFGTEYIVDGYRHRDPKEGPAEEYDSGGGSFWVEGKPIDWPEEFHHPTAEEFVAYYLENKDQMEAEFITVDQMKEEWNWDGYHDGLPVYDHLLTRENLTSLDPDLTDQAMSYILYKLDRNPFREEEEGETEEEWVENHIETYSEEVPVDWEI